MTVFVGRRDVVSVQGNDAAQYLQGQISQDVDELSVGVSAWSLILQPQGKIDAWFRITRRTNDAFLLDVDEGFGEPLLARLDRFRLRVDVGLELSTWDFQAHSETVEVDAPIVARSIWGTGVDVLGPDLLAPADLVMSAEQYLEGRVRAGVPAMGAELTNDTIPAEVAIVQLSVSFTKGCYTGQELVARMNSRGNNAPRRSRVVEGSGEPPLVGSALFHDGAEIATLTSVAGSSAGGWVALAFVKRASLDLTSASTDTGAAVAIDTTQHELTQHEPTQR